MAFTASNLNIRPGAAGSILYQYDAGSDSMVTVAAVGYFNNADDDQNFTVGDTIFAQCNDGNMLVKISSISSGSVTTKQVGDAQPWNGDISTASQALQAGISEIGTGTATKYLLPTPYAGAVINVYQSGTATGNRVFITAGTGQTVNAKGDRTITFNGEGDAFALLGVSATRWVITGLRTGTAATITT